MYRDRVMETSTSTGTGSITLSGAAPGFRTFSGAFGTNAAYYVIVNVSTPTEWEVGTFTVSGSTLGRSAGNVLAGSTGTGTLVNFSVGKKEIFNAPPASTMAKWDTYDPAGRVDKTGDSMTGELAGTTFKSGGNSSTTGYKVADGTDLSNIFSTGAGGLTAVSNTGTGAYGNVNTHMVDGTLSISGSTIVLNRTGVCNCDCRD